MALVYHLTYAHTSMVGLKETFWATLPVLMLMVPFLPQHNWPQNPEVLIKSELPPLWHISGLLSPNIVVQKNKDKDVIIILSHKCSNIHVGSIQSSPGHSSSSHGPALTSTHHIWPKMCEKVRCFSATSQRVLLKRWHCIIPHMLTHPCWVHRECFEPLCYFSWPHSRLN